MRDMEKKSTGFTLIEMLVGIVIGMIIVAAASVMMVTVLKSQKDITASARLNQELGAAMAVMSNEIRRAGFRICDVDVNTCDCNGDLVKEPYTPYNTTACTPELKDIEIDGSGNCIFYRYNGNLKIGEQRGFRFISDRIQMVVLGASPSCDDAVTSTTNWNDLTDPNVINITTLSFTTTNSKCRNLYKNWYSVFSNADETGMPCVVTTAVDCTDPSGGTCDSDTGDQLFGTRLVTIELQATLTKDSSVSKKLISSVKVASPWIGKAP